MHRGWGVRLGRRLARPLDAGLFFVKPRDDFETGMIQPAEQCCFSSLDLDDVAGSLSAPRVETADDCNLRLVP